MNQEWQIGHVRVVRIIENEVAVPSAMLFGDAAMPSADAHPWLLPHHVTEEGLLSFSIHVFVIDDGESVTLVDTCVGNHKVRSSPFFNGLDGPFLSRLADAGFPVASIDLVLCTHLHLDHVGWNTRLVDGAWVPTFPNARYLIARREWEHTAGEPVDPADDVIGDSVRPLFDARLVDLVDSDHRVSASIGLESTPGHTPGHVSVRISSDGADAVITGDLIHHPVQLVDVALATSLDSDTAAATVTRREVVAALADSSTLVLGTHFATPAGGRIVTLPSGLAFLASEATSISSQSISSVSAS